MTIGKSRAISWWKRAEYQIES